MKTETILLLLVAGYVLYKYGQPAIGPTHTVSCDAPGADPVMCQWLATHGTTDTEPVMPVMVP